MLKSNSSVKVLYFWTLSIVLPLSKTPSCLFSKHNILKTGFCLRSGDRTSSIDWTQLSTFYLKTETESDLRNVVFWKIKTGRWTMSNNIIIANVPSSQTFRNTSVRNSLRRSGQKTTIHYCCRSYWQELDRADLELIYYELYSSCDDFLSTGINWLDKEGASHQLYPSHVLLPPQIFLVFRTHRCHHVVEIHYDMHHWVEKPDHQSLFTCKQEWVSSWAFVISCFLSSLGLYGSGFTLW
jgi:hypothetical protein